MSIDLGAEFMKMALVKPGVPMETVLNRESQRKTPFALTIRKEERFFGSEALKKAVTAATRNTYTFFLDLIGKPFSHPSVQAYRERFPHIELRENEQRGGVNFVTDAGELPVETLLAMLLANARAEVEAYAGGQQPVRDAVIAVPAFYGEPERKAVEAAAQIAGINLIQLLSAGASAALNYGVFRKKDITEEPKTQLIYDCGSTKVQATIVQYVMATNTTSNETAPKLEVIGWAADPQLGGNHLSLKLRERLIDAFRQQNPAKTDQDSDDIAKNPQAMAKLLKESDRVKQVLSANSETFAQVESVFQDIDFRAKFSRQDLEELFKEFEPRLMDPVEKAMKMAQLDGENKDKLDRILLMGAGTRVPRLQELLGQYFEGKQLGRNLNTDEAIALGAVYQAARASKNFIVKRFDVIDSPVPTPPEPTAEGEEAKQVKPMSEEEISAAKTLLVSFEKLEKAKAERDHALHQLESAVFDHAYKLEEEEFRRYGTQDELDQIGKQLGELREWLEDVPAETGADQLKDKKRELMKPIRKMRNRKRQKEERPELMKTLERALDDANRQQLMFQNTTDIITEDELGTFKKMITDAQEWFDKIKAEVDGLADSQDATFTTDDLKNKGKVLDREAKFLFNKVIISLRQRDEAERVAKKAAEEEEAKKRAEEEATAAEATEGGGGDGRDEEAEEGKEEGEKEKKPAEEEEAKPANETGKVEEEGRKKEEKSKTQEEAEKTTLNETAKLVAEEKKKPDQEEEKKPSDDKEEGEKKAKTEL